MELIDNLKHMFSPRKSLKDLKVDDLRRERIRLEQTERKLNDEVLKLEEQKKQLFLKGKDEASARTQTMIARKIKDLEMQAQNYEKQLAFISKQTRVVNGFLQLKDNEKLMAESGLSTLIAQVDLATLQQYVDKASIDGVFHMDKLQEMLSTFEQGDRYGITGGEDKDVIDIVRQMQIAKQSESNPEAVENAWREADAASKTAAREAGASPEPPELS